MRLENIEQGIVIWGKASLQGIDQLKAKAAIIIVPEQRPSFTGLNQVIPRLNQVNIPYVYCNDNMLGLLFYKRKIKLSALFYKSCNDQGLVADSGSLYLVLLSYLHKVPITSLPEDEVNLSSLDYDATTIEGKELILANKFKDFTIPPKEELISWQLLKGD